MGFANNISGRARKAARLALNEIGRRAVADIRQSIEVRVQYIGNEVIRSEAGEPPRYEYALLWKSIKYRVASRATTIEALTIYTQREVAWYLENGFVHAFTGNFVEARPFWGPAWDRIQPYANSTFKTVFKEKLAGLNAAASDDFGGSDAPSAG